MDPSQSAKLQLDEIADEAISKLVDRLLSTGSMPVEILRGKADEVEDTYKSTVRCRGLYRHKLLTMSNIGGLMLVEAHDEKGLQRH